MDTALDNLDRLYDRQFWRDFAPDLHLEDADFLKSQTVFNVEEKSIETFRFLLKNEGYFQIPPPNWQLPIAGMAALVTKLDRAGLSVAFAFIYDEFWALYHRLNRILEAMLGPGFIRLPDFWAWHIRPEQSQGGWKPHRDRHYHSLFEDRTAKAVTVWIPLTDTTPLNGCMYIVPAYRDPTYGTPKDSEMRFGYPDIRALPAAAGTIFCWNQAVLHWGSHASERETRPRISVALEFQSGKIPPFNEPAMNPYVIPSFGPRTQLVAKQILQYAHMYPLSPAVEAMARKMKGNLQARDPREENRKK